MVDVWVGDTFGVADGSTGVSVGRGGTGVSVGRGGTGVSVGSGGIGVSVGSGGTGVSVGRGGTGVSVGGIGVSVGGMGVSVGGMGVSVGGGATMPNATLSTNSLLMALRCNRPIGTELVTPQKVNDPVSPVVVLTVVINPPSGV